MVGLGLALERHNNDRQTFVEQIIPGFAAFKSNQFQTGDVVVAVDQQNVEELDLDAIRQLTVGPENTFCTLQMMRGSRYWCLEHLWSCVWNRGSSWARLIGGHLKQVLRRDAAAYHAPDAG